MLAEVTALVDVPISELSIEQLHEHRQSSLEPMLSRAVPYLAERKAKHESGAQIGALRARIKEVVNRAADLTERRRVAEVATKLQAVSAKAAVELDMLSAAQTATYQAEAAALYDDAAMYVRSRKVNVKRDAQMVALAAHIKEARRRVPELEAADMLGGPFDVVVEDFAYDRHGFGGTGVEFWRRLRERLCVPGGTLVVNALYRSRREMDALERDLAEAGWLDVRRQVNRGLQAEDGEDKQVPLSKWRPKDNVIFAAKNKE